MLLDGPAKIGRENQSTGVIRIVLLTVNRGAMREAGAVSASDDLRVQVIRCVGQWP